MRLTFLAPLLGLLLTVLSTETPSRPHAARQMTRQELVARAKYPEFFGRRRRIAPRAESGAVAVNARDGSDELPTPAIIYDSVPDESVPTQAPIPYDCPTQRRRRRDVLDKYETPLSAREAAGFLLGHGEFTWCVALNGLSAPCGSEAKQRPMGGKGRTSDGRRWTPARRSRRGRR